MNYNISLSPGVQHWTVRRESPV